MTQQKIQWPRAIERYPLSNKPTLIITHKLQQQIDYLHKKVGVAEWSGELITREEGSITDLENWKVIAEDIWLADIGSPGFTGYEVDKGGFKATDIVEMYEAFPGLMDGTLKNHHIHTHHNMGAFFSGTDESNLEDRAAQSNYFMMLVVDFKKTYQAKVAFKAEIKSDGGTALHFANNHDNLEPLVLTHEKNREVLVVMEMNIKFEAAPSVVDDSFKVRFDAVKTALEEESRSKHSFYPGTGGSLSTFFRGADYGKAGAANSFNRGQSAEFPHFDWDDFPSSKKDKKRSKKRKKEKKITEMTDKEFQQFEQIQNGFEIRHATVLINAIIDKEYHNLNYKPVPTRLYNLDYELKTESKKVDWATGFVSSIPDAVELIFKQDVVEAQIAMMHKIIELLSPYMHTELIRIIIALVTDEVTDLTDEAMEEEAEASVASYTELSYSDETPAASPNGDLEEALEQSNTYVDKKGLEDPDLDDFSISQGNLFY